jgi:hypothetical protein
MNDFANCTFPSVALSALAVEPLPTSVLSYDPSIAEGLPSALVFCLTVSSSGLFPSSSHAIDSSTSLQIALFELEGPRASSFSTRSNPNLS